MDDRQDQAERQARPMRERLAGAPISWGACEVPGWGPMPDPEVVLTEMAGLGLRGTELGPPGFLPSDPTSLATMLAGHELSFVGAFVPLVLHEPDSSATARYAREMIDLLAAAGGQVLVVAAVQDPEWSEPRPLDDAGWRRFSEHASAVAALAAEHGLTVALHPHAGTLIETVDQVQRAIAETDVGWCLDTGHLMIGGTDPVQFARRHASRVTHVHLKDVDDTLAADVRGGRLTLLEATRRGLFLPLGRGAAGVATVLDVLNAHGYDGWLVLEQDTVIAADEPAADGGPTRDATESIALINSAQTEEINR